MNEGQLKMGQLKTSDVESTETGPWDGCGMGGKEGPQGERRPGENMEIMGGAV